MVVQRQTASCQYSATLFSASGNDNPNISFVQALAASGKISRAVYSLNAEKPINYRVKDTQGVVTNVYYGGFDRAKYEGPLTTLKTDHHGAYALPLRLSIDGEKLDVPTGQQVVLDTGGLSSMYTNSTLKKLSEKYGGDGVFYDGSWQFACGTKPILNYHFGETVIPVDLSASILPSPTGKCFLAQVNIVSEDTKVLLAGPPVISRSLVIYDNERDEVTIARAKYSDQSDVIEITGDIPGAVRANVVYN